MTEKLDTICQSCAFELSEGIYGTNIDGSFSSDYCIFCFQNGEFVESMTFQQAIEECIKDVSPELAMTREEAIEYAAKYLKTLKRWQS